VISWSVSEDIVSSSELCSERITSELGKEKGRKQNKNEVEVILCSINVLVPIGVVWCATSSV